jgi:hypothetical protein
MHRAALAPEARSKDLQDPIGLDQNPPEAKGVLWIVRTVCFVPLEGNRIGDLVRLGVDADVQAQ